MSNYVPARFVIRGKPEAIDHLIALVRGEAHVVPWWKRWLGHRAPEPMAFDLEAIVPIPTALLADREAMGRWMGEHWGVNRNVAETRFDRIAPDHAVLYFHSAYAMPSEALSVLATRIDPSLVLQGVYADPGNEYAGRITIAGGAMTETIEPFTRAIYREVTGEELDPDW